MSHVVFDLFDSTIIFCFQRFPVLWIQIKFLTSSVCNQQLEPIILLISWESFRNLQVMVVKHKLVFKDVDHVEVWRQKTKLNIHFSKHKFHKQSLERTEGNWWEFKAAVLWRQLTAELAPRGSTCSEQGLKSKKWKRKLVSLGIEPRTLRATVWCSTIELHQLHEVQSSKKVSHILGMILSGKLSLLQLVDTNFWPYINPYWCINQVH